MPSHLFDDILDIRVGGPKMGRGEGETAVVGASSVQQWQQRADDLRHLYVQTLGTIPADHRDVPLDLQRQGREDGGDHWRYQLTYRLSSSEQTSAWLLVPKEQTGPLPGLLTNHPTTPLGKEQTIGRDPTPQGQDRAYGLELVRRGYVTLSWDLMTANTRQFSGLEPFDTQAFYDRYPHWSARGKDIHDAHRAVDVLCSLPEVDPNRIGSMGHSQGGGMSIDAMVMDPRIKVGVSNCGDWPIRFMKNPLARCRTEWWVGTPALRPYVMTGKPVPVDVHEKLALIAPRPFLIITSLVDWDYSLAEEPITRPAWDNLHTNVARVYGLFDRAQAFQFHLHTQGHCYHAPERQLTYRFLDQTLGA